MSEESTWRGHEIWHQPKQCIFCQVKFPKSYCTTNLHQPWFPTKTGPMRNGRIRQNNPGGKKGGLWIFLSWLESFHGMRIPSLKLTLHLKMDGWKTSFLLGWLPGRCYVSFRGCNIYISSPRISYNGKLVVWGPGGWNSNRVPLSKNPFHKGIPNIQTTNLPLAEGMKKNLYHLESRWLSHVIGLSWPLQIATFWEWLASHPRTHHSVKRILPFQRLAKT